MDQERNSADQPPGSVSDQNNEEAPAPQGDPERHQGRRPDPGPAGGGESGGEAGEGSQSTGHPDSAG